MNINGCLAFLSILLHVDGGACLSLQKLNRTKRTILQLCELIQRYTNRGCLDYNNYGCFCGLGNAGSGRNPLDDVDECCLVHDRCYGDVSCWLFYPQLVGYNTHCNETGHCECQDSGLWSPCARSVCECDLSFAACLGQAQYNDDYRRHDWRLCNRT